MTERWNKQFWCGHCDEFHEGDVYIRHVCECIERAIAVELEKLRQKLPTDLWIGSLLEGR